MRVWTFQLARVAVLVAVALVVNFDRPAEVRGASAAAPDDGEASIRREVRLRKLHLVRPDLIPYPLSYEIYC